jgi:glycosyltransferase involved in cell wall biosynthesis
MTTNRRPGPLAIGAPTATAVQPPMAPDNRTPARRDCVLHLAGEYHDSLNKGKNSPVVVRLVGALSDSLLQYVVSINRTSNPHRSCIVEDAPQHLAIRYFALPYGIGHRFFLHRLADKISAWLHSRGIIPTHIVGHKFTIEGILAERLAREFGCAYVLGFMGTTDEKLWRALPWCRRSFARIASGASAWVFPTPVTQRRFEQRLSATPRYARVVPYISGVVEQPPVMRTNVNCLALLTVFNFQNLRYKNFERVVIAVMQLRAKGLMVTLDVAGHGDTSEVAKVQGVIGRHDAASAVRRIGHVPPGEMGQTMGRYGSMVLPSFPESFGLVYLEALAAGIPVMSSRGFALDGFFSAGYPGVKVDPTSVAAIEAGIRELVEVRPKFAAAFAAIGPEWQRFTRHHIRSSYLELVDRVRNEA